MFKPSPSLSFLDSRLDSEPELLAALQRTSPSPLYAGYGCGTLLLLLRDALSGQPDETDCPAQLFPPHAAGLPELAVCLLTGAAAPCTSPSLAAAWGFYDAGAVQWDLAAVSALAPTVCSKAVAAAVATHLPTLLPAGAEAGRVTATAAERYGLPIGARVFVALGDNQCQVAAQAAAALGDSDSRDSCGNAGVETETEGSAQHANRDLFVPALRRLVEAPQRVAFLNVGTSAQLTLLEPEERSDQACAEGMLELRPLLPGLRMLTVSSLNGGNVLAAVMHAANSTLGSASDTLEPLARLPYVPTTRLPQLCCVPRLYGERKAEAARMRCVLLADMEIGRQFFLRSPTLGMLLLLLAATTAATTTATTTALYGRTLRRLSPALTTFASPSDSWEGIDAEALEIPGALASALCRGLVANLYDALPAAVRSSVAAVYCGGRAAVSLWMGQRAKGTGHGTKL